MNFIAVFVGDGLGILIRYVLCLILLSSSYLPLATLIENFFGCYIATIVFVYFVFKSGLNPTCKTFLITGFCGGLSTLSVLAYEMYFVIYCIWCYMYLFI